jgi:hypothetical protein
VRYCGCGATCTGSTRCSTARNRCTARPWSWRGVANLATEGEALIDLVQTLAWCRPAEARQLQPRALEVNEALRNQVEIVKIRAANGVALASLGKFAEADAEIGRGLTLTEQCGYPGGLVWCWVARTFGQVRHAGAAAAREPAARVAAIVGDLDGNRFWSEIVDWWTGAVNGQAGATGWLDGEDAARARWMAVLPGSEPDGR